MNFESFASDCARIAHLFHGDFFPYQHNGRVMVDAKTGRWGDEGTMPPSRQQDAAVGQLAKQYGMAAVWHEIEKGWGYFELVAL